MNLNNIVVVLLLVGLSYAAKKTAKNGKQLTIRCNKVGTFIAIQSATFGFKRNNPNKGCESPTATVIVEDLCDGDTECLVTASRTTFIDSTCTGNEKETLVVKYRCEKPNNKPPKTKNGRTLDISCSFGSLITITSATYSFRDGCGDPNAKSKVEALCNQLESCSVTADSTVFDESTCTGNNLGKESLLVFYSCKRANGPSFITWGSGTCPTGSDIVYTGIMGGAKSTSGYGNGGNYQCLPLNPTYGESNTTANPNRGAIYAAVFIEATSASNQGILQCAMCQAEEATSLITLVGTISCPSGWTSLYDGNLVSEKEETTGFVSSKGFECLKLNPDTITNDDTSSTDVSEVHFVEQVCGTLPCASYTTGDEVGCVVCSI